MEGDERRIKIMDILNNCSQPISGSELSEKLKVSRQIIVQDIALLRAVNKNIISTNKGYVLYQDSSRRFKRSFQVCHDDGLMEDELNTIVDNNGKVLDVVVEHDIYGQITVDLIIASRRDVKEFLEKINRNKTKPLYTLTDGVHYHTVEADEERDLDIIQEALREKGFLYEE